MTLFCKYKHIFGNPKEGVHKYRLFDIAVIDVLFTILVIFILSKVTHSSVWIITIGMMFFMILCHRLFCVRTTTDKLLFPS